MIYQCNKELILSLSPSALREVAEAIDNQLILKEILSHNLTTELQNLRNELWACADHEDPPPEVIAQALA